MYSVKFKYSDESYVYHKLITAVNVLCAAKGKNCLCTSGYRSLAKQKVINAQSLAQRKSQGGYQLSNGAVYTPDGKCWAAPFGKSNHCFCIAMDITDEWFNKLSNSELKKYGLIKPMSYEPWHVELIETRGLSQLQKEAIRDSVLRGTGENDMNVKEFQAMTGLKDDGIVGPVTKAKAKEMLQVCQEILGNKFDNPESVIKACMSNPGMWTKKLSEVPHLGDYTMNIVKMMGGRT
ncbi:peptidase M15B and M15C DD-carboxypeptidase VanY/endolysin [Ruminiclostridium papyrosolvens DSM 2782]|uniref:Peptidase M15B and M15C DD-carboxypeptidase VanY/endolysin n=1 Tax=Ruminiclostridium papyrosolvens DSM 2782 TaxID=588581 RepID=F1TEI5_9FIRM|nr:D-alanyl-D-alanine carboxypeptidase family protein [Ruminiclostridium papyrosolvens]EGD47151.1 peptidase M15B and M15C DD-carboxypeptidase VanY/endolysin [Ruminiclostridium papyrosolvens DSM 2782]WES36093.1 D-alanyl-D-alanine carboxypeptidase family protein [Ruminiclostridium papyrosolvens DSM 2782]WES36191.1 D-alanyl-D-alanine carboxypeptidase family protein [Ruminiclostridium papyrosolvens DSM 2782]